MRILKVQFQNLNSLKGEWTIDFTDPAYQSEGLFAITGPTGAGKSTVLDAICLSLYGKTPRLSSISNNSNEIMNRTSAECYSETTFSNEKGTFRSRFEQHYSRGKRDGNLIQPTMELYNVDEEKVIASGKSTALNEIKNTIGLTYEQFTRAVLLAQGQFKNFLDADANDRSELLETITGTQMYSVISEKVFYRLRDEEKKLYDLKTRLEGIELLTEEQEKELGEQSKTIEVTVTELNKEITLLQQQLQWLKDVDGLKNELEKIQSEQTQNEKAIKEFEPQRFQLLRDTKALKIRPDYQQMEQHKKTLGKLDGQILNTTQKIEQLEKARIQTAKDVTESEKRAEEAKAELDKQTPIITQTKELDAVIRVERENLKPEQEKYTRFEQDFYIECRKAKVLPDNLPSDMTVEKIDSQIQTILWGTSISETYDIIDGFRNLYNSWNGLLNVKTQIAKNVTDINKYSELLKQATKDSETLNAQKSEQNTLHKTTEELVQSLETSIERGKAILSFEEHRHNLADGSPCPLCGATSHPYCENEPEISLSDEEKQLAEKKKQIRNIDKKIVEIEKQLARVQTESQQAQKLIDELTAQNEEQIKQSDYICKTILNCDTDISIGEIRHRLNRIEIKANRTKERLEKASKIDALRKPIQTRDDLNNQLSTLNKKQDALNTLLEQRHELFGDNNPDVVLNSLKRQLETAQTQLGDLRQQVTKLETELKSTAEQKDAYLEEHKVVQKTYADSVTEFNSKLTEEQFQDTNDFLTAILTDIQRESLQKQQSELAETKIRLETRLNANQEKLQTLEQQNLTDKPADELQTSYQEKSQQRDESNQKLGTIKERLHNNDVHKKSFAKVQKECDEQQLTTNSWSYLNSLIGSSDGKKFRKIVQRLSLEFLIDYANEEMTNLAPRYQLTIEQSAGEDSDSDEKKPKSKASKNVTKDELAIYCIDSWQGGVVRPTCNLSGGESFLVSLALALGLSKMSSQNMTLETLFLDEGFGTLDDQTLQTALDAISQFQYSGDTNKLVGIISHVDALKERISNKIEVSRASNGVSVLSGPGVTKNGLL